MSDDVSTRVARGVALLDEQKPGWAGLIDLSTFDITRCDRCVLGQLFDEGNSDVYGSGYGLGAEVLLGIGSGYGLGAEKLGIEGSEAEHGFDSYLDTGYYYQKDEFPELQQEWVRVIEVLRQKAQAIEEEPSEEDKVLARTLETIHG
jgi:hypothetical protein